MVIFLQCTHNIPAIAHLFRGVLGMSFESSESGPRFNIMMSSYQYRKSHCGDKTVVRSSYLHNRIFYTDKISFLYWIQPWSMFSLCHCHMLYVIPCWTGIIFNAIWLYWDGFICLFLQGKYHTFWLNILLRIFFITGWRHIFPLYFLMLLLLDYVLICILNDNEMQNCSFYSHMPP